MPAFTFEKISPPLRRGPAPPADNKPRSFLIQILDRFVEARIKRNLGAESIARRGQRHRVE